MGWRERFGADDERAEVAARARALLTAAGHGPSPATSAVGGAPPGAAVSVGERPPEAFPSPRGGWVPPGIVPEVGDRVPVGSRSRSPQSVPPPVPSLAADVGRHARAATPPAEPTFPPAPAYPEQETARAGWRDRIRVDPGRRGLVAVAAVVVVVGSVAGGVLFRGGQSSAVTLSAASGAPAPSDASPAPVEGSPGRSSAPSASASGATSTSTPTGTVTVDVAGLVTHPGVYTLPTGSRVEDALDAAGGARPGADLSTVNRARVLVDGEQLAVGVPGAPGAPAAASGSAVGSGAGAPGGLVDLNTAGLADLDTLPGVGPVLAQAILDWRTEHGGFSSVGDLDQVAGIGPATFAKLKDLVTV